MHKTIPAALISLILCLGGCEVTESGSSKTDSPGTLTIATWNVQTLFDGAEAGTEYDDYRGSAGWTGEKYTARLNSFAQAISRMIETAPDILGLIEIENSPVLTDLVTGFLSKYGYHWTFFASNPNAALGIGMISRFPFTETKVHSITAQGETIPRPVLEVRLQPQDTPVVLFVCHWKSKVGGDTLTESSRRASARVIQRRLWEIRQENPVIPVVIMGDLNENHDEFYRNDGSVISALLPDDQKAAELTGFIQAKQQDFLILSRNKPPTPEYFASDATVLYSPWGNELQDGSYHYKGAWETIDHFLLTDALFDQTGWDFDSCRVINQEPFVDAHGNPAAYNPRTGNGLSDHLPLVLVLKHTPGAAFTMPE
ncbi:MAG: endonuclease/exonuclease/phosphatase family protein [Treponema sp.]|jgi:endonuclease/exonuclease/phosphatase family metal-dependent hydrolase|nr:endonuclease/exonuclease/phosphatase family protein [Treponema sp.]